MKSRLRVFVSSSLGVACGIFAFPAAAALTDSRFAAALIAAVVSGVPQTLTVVLVVLALRRRQEPHAA